MADNLDRATRSRTMASVKSANTGPELLLRRALHASGVRYRTNVRHLPGKPDVVFPRSRALLFIHGCFWHGHNCPAGRLPKTRLHYWRGKIRRNRNRDARNSAELRALGWRVGVIWECALTGTNRRPADYFASRIKRWLHSTATQLDVRGIRMTALRHRRRRRK